ncbi:surfeit locus protein 6 homolog [Papilio machaon]|uniref:surfeit locus protein 6 homolog n=1 Tax=Papilio machaon TaxID=76193 RepID=UPI001E66394E|nr:surfeit locus protein 6 homolog [Papilio machaon]
MPSIMASQKKTLKTKQLKSELSKELQFIKNIFSSLSLPIHKDDDANNDFEMTNGVQPEDKKELHKRASSIVELEEKLQKLKSQNNFHLKNKLAKKSINSKLNKKLKKRERTNKTHVKGSAPNFENNQKQQADDKKNVNIAKPIFNSEGKLVFSKFDFANFGKKEKSAKAHKDPKKILEDMKQQENKFRELQESDKGDKVKEIKEKMAWKNILQKAEGQKVKDDPILLKKSIKRMDQKKKASKKQWENRIKGVEQKKEDRQKKRKENISKKKKEKKTKIVKAAVKRGRVVL